MGGNVSKETEEGTIIAFTMYGFGCSRCCSQPVFLEGAPRNTCCGTSCGQQTFPPVPSEYADIIADFGKDLPMAAQEAEPHLSWWSHVVFSQFDATANKAAAALNQPGGWCYGWNENKLHDAGLHCTAASEVYGFGRSRVTYLVIRIRAAQKA